MNNLVRVIGPAPSEMTPERLISKLELERTRVRQALERFAKASIPKPKSPTKVAQRKVIKDSGFSVEELRILLQEEIKKKGV